MTNINSKNRAQYFTFLAIILLSLHPQYGSSQTRSIDPEVQRQIDEFVENVYLPSSQIGGLGLSIVQNDGEVLYTTGYGLADKEKEQLNQNSTQFLIGSVTKSFTSILVVKLLHENFPSLGEAVLDTPIQELFPQRNFTLIDRFRSEQATFRDLLGHRMCLAIEDLQLVADPFNTTEEITYRTRYQPEICGIRTQFVYHQQMFVMAGELAGILANRSYEDAARELLNAIGMTNTVFLQKTDDFTKLPRAMPHYVKDNEIHPYNPELVKRFKLHNAAGGLFAPPDDMAKYMQFYLNLGSVDGKEIVPREVMEWLRKPSIFVSSNLFKNSEEDLVFNGFGYGLGVALSSYDGWQCIQHTGSVAPYSSLMTLYPGKRLGIFTNTNMGPVRLTQHVLHAFIFETLRGSENQEEKAMTLGKVFNSAKEKKEDNAKKEFEVFNNEILRKAELRGKSQAEIIGKYGSGPQGDAEVTEKFNDQTNQTMYYFEYGRWAKAWLEDQGNGVIFKLIYDTDIIQDEYAEGFSGDSSYLAFDNGTLLVFTSIGNLNLVRATFKLGVSLDTLPPVPWSPDSC